MAPQPAAPYGGNGSAYVPSPAAPQVAFVPHPVAPHPPHPIAGVSHAPQASPRPFAPDLSFQAKPHGKSCAVCGTQNPGDVRYCISCGTMMEKAAPGASPPAGSERPLPLNAKGATSLGGVAPVALAPPISPQSPAVIAPVSPQFPAAIAPIAPMRVVDIGSTLPKDTTRVCARCHGSCDATASFCKFCGAALTESAPTLNPTIAHPIVRDGSRDAVAPASVRPAPIASANPIGAASVLTPSPAAVAPPPPTPAPGPVAVYPSPIASASSAEPVALQTRAPAPPLSTTTPITAATPANGAPVIPGLSATPAIGAPLVSLSPTDAPARFDQAAAQVTAGAEQRGRLVVVARDGGEGPAYPLYDQVDIGREEGHVLIADDGYLSPRHARLTWRAGRLFLHDLASANGIYLRLSRARGASTESEATRRLEDQDLILVGQQVLRFEIVRDGEAGLGPASEHGTLLFGTPVGPRYARLCQRSVEGVSRDVYYLRKMETVLGRESGDIIFTEDPFLSRRHAAVRIERSGSNTGGSSNGGSGGHASSGSSVNGLATPTFTLVDLGSSNGCFVRIRGELEVTHGDQFRVGQQLFRVELGQPS